MRDYDEQSLVYDYRGKRGLVLLRVSTEEQEKKYGFPSQLLSISHHNTYQLITATNGMRAW